MGKEFLTNDFQQLKEQAYLMMLKAYAPYSKFLVGAAVLGDSKKISPSEILISFGFPFSRILNIM